MNFSKEINSAAKFIAGVILIHVVTYFLAGIFATSVLGSGQYYPPSPNAVSYFRDPMSPHVQSLLIPAAIVRGLLYALALYPFRRRIMELGQLYGGLAVTGLAFIMGWVAAAGGIIEHYVFLAPMPLGFIIISFIEILLQTLLFGQFLIMWEKRFNLNYYSRLNLRKSSSFPSY